MDRADFPSFFALVTVRTRERSALVFGQALEAFPVNVFDVGERDRPACVRRSKAEAFGVVENFEI
jgi:hypothetical protein